MYTKKVILQYIYIGRSCSLIFSFFLLEIFYIYNRDLRRKKYSLIVIPREIFSMVAPEELRDVLIYCWVRNKHLILTGQKWNNLQSSFVVSSTFHSLLIL